MPTLSLDELHARLVMLDRSITDLPPGDPCPWPVARVFNALLGAAKEHVEEDPIVGIISTLKPDRPESGDIDASVTPLGALRPLVGQIVAALNSKLEADTAG